MVLESDGDCTLNNVPNCSVTQGEKYTAEDGDTIWVPMNRSSQGTLLGQTFNVVDNSLYGVSTKWNKVPQ
jgi:hypothetical protein